MRTVPEVFVLCVIDFLTSDSEISNRGKQSNCQSRFTRLR